MAAVKGQHMPGYDPRIIKGIGVTYATSPMEADRKMYLGTENIPADMRPAFSQCIQDLIGLLN